MFSRNRATKSVNADSTATIKKIVGDAVVAVERDNPCLKGVLPNDYARPGLEKLRLTEFMDVIATTRRLTIMNLAIRGLEADIGKKHVDTFRNVQHPNLRADCVLARALSLPRQRDIRGACREAAPEDTALRDAAFSQMGVNSQVLSVAKDNMVAFPGQLFYSTKIPVCLWFFAKTKVADAKRGLRVRRKQTFLINARKLSTLIDRKLTDAALVKMTNTCRLW